MNDNMCYIIVTDKRYEARWPTKADAINAPIAQATHRPTALCKLNPRRATAQTGEALQMPTSYGAHQGKGGCADGLPHILPDESERYSDETNPLPKGCGLVVGNHPNK